MALPPDVAPLVLYADNHLLVVCKPAGLPAQPSRIGEASLHGWAKGWIRAQKNKAEASGDVYCGLVHRLDRNTSGVVVLARTTKAARRLSAQWAARSPSKSYLALLSPPPALIRAHLEHGLERDEDTRTTKVHPVGTPGTQVASLDYEVVVGHGEVSLVAIELHTGRAHQIRAQLAAVGAPVVGDRKYGGVMSFAGLALHAHSVELDHPTQKERLSFAAPLPDHWPAWARAVESGPVRK